MRRYRVRYAPAAEDDLERLYDFMLERDFSAAERALDAIRTGQVEALVVATPAGPKVYTLEGADHRYRRLVETMSEGALIVSAAGTVLYSNAAFARMVK